MFLLSKYQVSNPVNIYTHTQVEIYKFVSGKILKSFYRYSAVLIQKVGIYIFHRKYFFIFIRGNVMNNNCFELKSEWCAFSFKDWLKYFRLWLTFEFSSFY